MTDLLLPATDGGVAAQAAIVTVGFAALLWLVRTHKEVRLLVVGMWLLAYGSMGLRALH